MAGGNGRGGPDRSTACATPGSTASEMATPARVSFESRLSIDGPLAARRLDMVSPRNGVFVVVAVVAARCRRARRNRASARWIGDVASGPNTVEAARKALQGSWVLSSLNVTGPDGRTGAIDAIGAMNFDSSAT